eukprot:gene22188-28726_t
MTSLRVALKLSMAANQGTPSASAQSHGHQSSSKISHVAKTSGEKSAQKQPSTTAHKDGKGLANSVSDAQSIPVSLVPSSQNDNENMQATDSNASFSPISTQNNNDDEIKSAKKAGPKGIHKNSKKDQSEVVLNDKKKRADIIENSTVDTRELVTSNSESGKSDDERSLIPVNEAICLDFSLTIPEASDIKDETSELNIIDVKKSPDYFYCSNGDAISDSETGHVSSVKSMEVDPPVIEPSPVETVAPETVATESVDESASAVSEAQERDPVLKGEEIDVDESLILINDNKVAESTIENDVTTELPVTTEKKKVKRKRTPSILKALDPVEIPEQRAGDSDSDDDSNSGLVQRYQSNRAAAKVAKTKFSSRLKPGEDFDNGKLAAESAASQPPKQEWVMCDLCKKWRSIASHMNERDLPDEWFCNMNTWSEKYSSCDAPEEPYQKEPTKGVGRGAARRRVNSIEEAVDTVRDTRVVHRGGREGGRGGRGHRGRWGHRRIQKSGSEADDNNRKTRRNESGSDDGDGEPTAGIASARKKLANKPIQHSQAVGAASDAVSSPENWVLCNKCDKWRKVPKTIAVESLPETWYCSLNTWNPAVARCAVPQEKDDSAGAAGADSNIPATRQRRVGHRAASTKANENDQWVQCEHQNCQKWRRVPAHIDIKSLPEIWYCEMNSWDMESTKCSAPQKDDAEERFQSEAYGPTNGNKKPTGVNHNLITANSKGAGALSYRRIIFGNDGRIRSCFSDKNKNGFGLFSYPESNFTSNYIGDRLSQLQQSVSCSSTDSLAEGTAADATSTIFTATNTMKADYSTKRVTYWWSSAYNEAAVTYNSGAPTRSNMVAKVQADDYDSQQQTTCLVDAVRKISGFETCTYPHQAYPSAGNFSQRPQQYRKVPKSWKVVSDMGILQRDWAECCAVRSCFLLTPSMTLTMPLIISLMSSITFQREDVDAAREQLLLDKSFSRLRVVFRRLEERGEAEVSYTSTGALSVQMLYISDCPDIHTALNSQTISSVNTCEDDNRSVKTKWVKGFSYRNSFTSCKDEDGVKKSLPPKMRKFYDLKGNLRGDISSQPGTPNATGFAQEKVFQKNAGNQGRKMNVDIDNILSSVGKPFSVVKAFTGRGAARKADGTSQLKGRRKKIIPAEDHDQDSVASLPKAVDNKLSAAMMFPIDSVPAYVVNEIPSLPAPDDVVEERKMETEKDVSVSDSESFFSSVDEDDGDSDEMVVDAAESVEDLSSIKRESFSETVRSLGEADEKGAVEEVDMDSSSEFESGSDSESHDARSLEGKGDSEGNQMVGDDKRDTN